MNRLEPDDFDEADYPTKAADWKQIAPLRRGSSESDVNDGLMCMLNVQCFADPHALDKRDATAVVYDSFFQKHEDLFVDKAEKVRMAMSFAPGNPLEIADKGAAMIIKRARTVSNATDEPNGRTFCLATALIAVIMTHLRARDTKLYDSFGGANETERTTALRILKINHELRKHGAPFPLAETKSLGFEKNDEHHVRHLFDYGKLYAEVLRAGFRGKRGEIRGNASRLEDLRATDSALLLTLVARDFLRRYVYNKKMNDHMHMLRKQELGARSELESFALRDATATLTKFLPNKLSILDGAIPPLKEFSRSGVAISPVQGDSKLRYDVVRNDKVVAYELLHEGFMRVARERVRLSSPPPRPSFKYESPKDEVERDFERENDITFKTCGYTWKNERGYLTIAVPSAKHQNRAKLEAVLKAYGFLGFSFCLVLGFSPACVAFSVDELSRGEDRYAPVAYCFSTGNGARSWMELELPMENGALAWYKYDPTRDLGKSDWDLLLDARDHAPLNTLASRNADLTYPNVAYRPVGSEKTAWDLMGKRYVSLAIDADDPSASGYGVAKSNENSFLLIDPGKAILTHVLYVKK